MSTSRQPVTCVESTVNANHKQTGLEWLPRDMGQIRRPPLTFVVWRGTDSSCSALWNLYLSAIIIGFGYTCCARVSTISLKFNSFGFLGAEMDVNKAFILLPINVSMLGTRLHSFFYIRTSNFDAGAERSYIFWRFEAETFLKMFLNLPGIVFQPISADVTDTRFLKKT